MKKASKTGPTTSQDCRCQRSACSKNYCRCYNANRMCGASCKCLGESKTITYSKMVETKFYDCLPQVARMSLQAPDLHLPLSKLTRIRGRSASTMRSPVQLRGCLWPRLSNCNPRECTVWWTLSARSLSNSTTASSR